MTFAMLTVKGVICKSLLLYLLLSCLVFALVDFGLVFGTACCSR